MEVFDKNGDLVEGVFSQDELDAKIKEIKDSLTLPAPIVPIAPVILAEPTIDPKIAALEADINNLKKGFEINVTSKFGIGLTPEQKATFEQKFTELSSIPSYDTSPTGLERRANDAYTLVTGQPYTHNAMNMNNIGVASGKSSAPANKELREEDKSIAEMLGNTPDDYKKYGNT
jgi:hypothetical protein